MRVIIFVMSVLCTIAFCTGDQSTDIKDYNTDFESISSEMETYLAPGEFVSWHIDALENKIEPAILPKLPELNNKLADSVPADWQLVLRRNLDQLAKIELNAEYLKETPYYVCFYDINRDLYPDMFLTTREGQLYCFLGPDFYKTDEVFSKIELPKNSKIGFWRLDHLGEIGDDDLIVAPENEGSHALYAPEYERMGISPAIDKTAMSILLSADKYSETIKNLGLQNVNSSTIADVNGDSLDDFVYVTDKGVYYRENIGTLTEPEYIKYTKKVDKKINVQTEYAAAPFSLKVSETGYRLFVGNQEGQIDVFDTIFDENTYKYEPFTKIKTIKKDDIESPVIPFVLDLNSDLSVESIIVNTAGEIRIYENADFEKELVKIEFEKDAYPDFFDLNEDSMPDILYFNAERQLVWRKNTSENAGAISFDAPKALKIGENLKNVVKDEKFLSIACTHFNTDEIVDYVIGFADGRVRFFASPDYTETKELLYELDAGEYAIPRLCIVVEDETKELLVGNAEGDVKFYVSCWNINKELNSINSYNRWSKKPRVSDEFCEYMGWTQEFETDEEKEAYFDSIGDDDKAVLVLSMENVREVYEKMILDAPKHLRDEIAFTIANAPTPVLRTMFELGSQDILIENAKQIYAMAKQLGYAEIVELEDGKSTLKYKRENGNWEEIPSNIYYWWVVHPRLLFEIPARINCDYWHKNMQEHGVDELTWLRHEDDIYAEPERGDFWRSFFPVNNHYDRRLIDYAQRAETFEQAMKRAHEYVSWTFADSFMRFGYKTQDLQAIQIYYKGYGSCGEQSIIAAAVARSILIPTAIVTNHGEDHQWDEIYRFGDWVHWDINNLDMDAPWNSTEGFTHRKGCGAINNWWGNDYSEPTTARVNTPKGAGYTKTGKGYTDIATINIYVYDKTGKPVENAMVLVKSHWNDANQTSVRAYTGADGKVTVEVGEGRKNGYTICAITSAGAAGVQQIVVEENKEYNVSLSVSGVMQERKDRVKLTENKTEYNEFAFDFNLKKLESLLLPPNPTTSRPFRINSETISKTNYRGTRDYPQPMKNDENLKLYLFEPAEYLKFVIGENATAFKIVTLDSAGKIENIGMQEECYAVLMNTKSLFIHKKIRAEISMQITAEAPEIELTDDYSGEHVVSDTDLLRVAGEISDNSNEVYLEASSNGGFTWFDCSDCINTETNEFTVVLPQNMQTPVVPGRYRLLLRACDGSGRMKYAQPVDFTYAGTKHFMNQVFVQDDPETPLPKSSWMFGPFRIDEGTRFIAIKTEGHSEGFDLDLYLFFDKNKNLKLDGMEEERTKSASPTANEKIFLANPAAGTYWIYAQGWKVEGDQAFADIHVSFDYKPRLLKNISPQGAKKTVDQISAEFVHVAGILTEKVKIYLNDEDFTANAEISNDGFTLVVPESLKNGQPVDVKVLLEDYSGNTDEVTWRFRSDNVTPQILSAEINAEQAETGFINLNTAIDENVLLQYSIDGGEFASFKERKMEFAEAVDVFELSGGLHQLVLKAVDGAGNFCTKTLEFAMPEIKIALRLIGKLSETGAIGIPNQTLKFKVKAEGNVLPESIVVLLDGKKYPGVATIAKDILYLMSFDSYNFGEHKIEIYLADDKGNKLAPFVFEFKREIPEKK